MAIELDAIVDTLLDNASWKEEASLTKAKAFATAARQYLLVSPAQSSQPGGFSISLSVDQIKSLLDEASAFVVASQQASNGVQILGAAHGFR